MTNEEYIKRRDAIAETWQHCCQDNEGMLEKAIDQLILDVIGRHEDRVDPRAPKEHLSRCTDKAQKDLRLAQRKIVKGE